MDSWQYFVKWTRMNSCWKDLFQKILFTLTEWSTKLSLMQVWNFISSTTLLQNFQPVLFFLFASMNVICIWLWSPDLPERYLFGDWNVTEIHLSPSGHCYLLLHTGRTEFGFRQVQRHFSFSLRPADFGAHFKSHPLCTACRTIEPWSWTNALLRPALRLWMRKSVLTSCRSSLFCDTQ